MVHQPITDLKIMPKAKKVVVLFALGQKCSHDYSKVFERAGIPYLYQLTLESGKDFLNSRVRAMPAAKFLAALS